MNAIPLSADQLNTLLVAARAYEAELSNMIRLCDDISDRMDLDAEREVLRSAIKTVENLRFSGC